jgi:molecular chaperone HtpG
VIGQFGVGFYAVFMVADRVRVVSRSYKPDADAWAWESDGGDNFTIEAAERETRGTDVIITLKDDAKAYLQPWKLKEIIRRHSDYIAFPIYVAGEEEPANRQIAIWRQDPKEISDEQYSDFYRSLTLDFQPPLHHIHIRADLPLQFYALLYIPTSAEATPFNLRREPGLKLYARKVLIEEYNKDLLPEYLQFVQGVVDSEDLPLNVSRESVQANRVMVNLRGALTGRVLSDLKRLAKNDTPRYLDIYHAFGRYIKQGIVVDAERRAEIEPLLYFPSTKDDDADELHTLADYVGRMAHNQTDIYYVIGGDFHSARRSPHLDAFRQRGIEVLYFTDPVDPFLLMGLTEFQGHKLRSVDEADIDLRDIGAVKADTAPQPEPLNTGAFGAVRQRAAAVLGERVRDVRESKTLSASPARLVSDDSAPQRNLFRINRLLDRDYELPVKTLELNPRHPLLHNLSALLEAAPDNPLIDVAIEQLFETALLQDGIHPNPAAMAERLHLLLQAATGPAPDADVLRAALTPRPSAPEPNSEAEAGADDTNGE